MLKFKNVSPAISTKFTFAYSYWYCCLDVSVSRQMLVTGDNMGQLVLLGLDGQKVCRHKVNQVDYFSRQSISMCCVLDTKKTHLK